MPGVKLLNRERDLAMLLNLEELAAQFRVNKNTISQWVANGEFPAPIRIGRRTLRWREADIDAFVEKLVAESANAN